jgi:hypothetical protein
MSSLPTDSRADKPTKLRLTRPRPTKPASDLAAQQAQSARQQTADSTARSSTLTGELLQLNKLRDAGEKSASRELRKQLASRYGVTTRTVSNWMPIVTLGPELRDAVDRGQLLPGIAAKLVHASPEMLDRVTAALAAGLGVAEIKQIVRKPRVPAENQAATAATLIGQAHDLLLRARRLPPEMFPRAGDGETWAALKAVGELASEMLTRRPRRRLRLKICLKKGGQNTPKQA